MNPFVQSRARKTPVVLGALSLLGATGCSTMPYVDKKPEQAPERGYFLSVEEAQARGGVAGYVPRVSARSSVAAPAAAEVPVRVTQAAPAPVPAPRNLADKIFFSLDSAQIGKSDHLKLDEIAAYLRADSNQKIQLEGHADQVGPENDNLALSRSRAAEVRNYLVAKGVASAQIETQAFGESKARPVVSRKLGNPDDRNVTLRLESAN